MAARPGHTGFIGLMTLPFTSIVDAADLERSLNATANGFGEIGARIYLCPGLFTSSSLASSNLL